RARASCDESVVNGSFLQGALVVGALWCASAGAVLGVAAEATPGIDSIEERHIGLQIGGPELGCELQGPQADAPLPALIAVGAEKTADPTWLHPLIRCAPERHLEIMVRLVPPADWTEATDPYQAIAGWMDLLDRSLQAWRGSVRRIELGRRPETVFPPHSYAF